jgi:hypothetical protein
MEKRIFCCPEYPDELCNCNKFWNNSRCFNLSSYMEEQHVVLISMNNKVLSLFYTCFFLTYGTMEVAGNLLVMVAPVIV